MLRISCKLIDGTINLQLEGKLLGLWVEEFRCAVNRERGTAQRLVVDLAAVRFVDSAGAVLLRTLVSEGVAITRASGFVNALLDTDTITNTHPIELASEVALVAAVKAGDAAAYETLVRRHGPPMRAVARRYLRSEADSDDAVQDAFISALGAMANFKATSSLGTWLHRITVNACLMKLRRIARRPETSIEDLLPQFESNGQHSRRPMRFADDVVNAASADETQQIVRDAIDQLPETYREILLLRDIENIDTAETAALLNTNETNVKTRLHRARQALRTLLESVFAADMAQFPSRNEFQKTESSNGELESVTLDT